MKICLVCSQRHSKQMERDKETLLKSMRTCNVDLPITVEQWELYYNEKIRYEYAESRYFKKEKGGLPEHGFIWFYEKYFEQKQWNRRWMTFLHELIHIYLFSSESKYHRWFIQVEQLEKERIEKEESNRITSYVYAKTLQLPLEMLAEECFKQKYTKLFKIRTDVFYNLRVESENEFDKLKTNLKNKGCEFVAPYVVYVEILKIGHFLKLINSGDNKNLKRFKELYERWKDELMSLSKSEQIKYFDTKEKPLTKVSLEPLFFPKNDIIDLASRF